jgi:catechol 2,3-dioxygenase-like lactoylglutathione lyase family enzyme
MFDHIGVGVSDLNASKAFFLRALFPLSIAVVMKFSHAAGLGRAHKPSLWLGTAEGTPLPLHIAFAADNRSQVDEFYRQALAAGGKDNGPPGDSASLSCQLLCGLRHWAGRS